MALGVLPMGLRARKPVLLPGPAAESPAPEGQRSPSSGMSRPERTQQVSHPRAQVDSRHPASDLQQHSLGKLPRMGCHGEKGGEGEGRDRQE